jgi:serine/threonine-protein kinase
MSAPGASPPMTPERWRAVDAVLQAALACEPDRREAFVAEACGGDEGLRREVTSLLAAFDGATDGFLERPAAEALGVQSLAGPLDARLAEALGGHYAVEGEIARGGMAAVYLARDLRHDRRVAIKVLREEVAAAVGAERFLEEIRVTASLQHPHILPLFDSGSAGGLLWYVMPFVDGETLRARLGRERRLGVAESVRLAREVADALEHAHRHGVVHRDVKPENILLQDGHALVADFGIALALEHAGGERLTRTGLTLGTPQYMPPEQAAGERGIDERADVYALGAVLHEMLAGEPPFAAATRQAVVQRLMHEPPTPLAASRADVPPAVDSAVRRALKKRPEARFATAAAFADALDARWTASDEPALDLRGGRRTVGARVAAYALLVGLTVGLAGGWSLARSSLVQRWTASPAAAQPSDPGDNVVAAPPNAPAGGLSLVVVDRAGRVQREIAANRPWTPRFSPNGKWLAYGAYGAGRTSSDIFVADLSNGTTRRLTDDDGDSNDPQWSADGTTVAYSVNAPGGKDIAMRSLKGGVAPLLASRPGTQFASDWLRDGSALLVTDDGGPDGRHDILVQPADGSAARPYAATDADETAARASPDGRWVAYTSDASGREEVYLDSFSRPGKRVMISQGGGRQPVWRGDGRELYYWRGDELVAVHVAALNGDAPPTLDTPTALFRVPVQGGLNTMYDVSPDGQRFVIVRHP